MKMKITIIGIAAIVGLILYGNSLRKKKKQLKETSSNNHLYEVVETQKFTIEEMLTWFKSHDDVNDSDEYILSRITEETLHKGEINKVLSIADIEHSIMLLITDSTHKRIKHARIIKYSEIESDILDMLGDKQLIVLE